MTRDTPQAETLAPSRRIYTTLGEVAEAVEQAQPDRPFVYLDIGSIDRESKTFVDCKSLTPEEAPSRARQLVRHGDVLVSMTRPNLNAVAMPPDDDGDFVASTGFQVLRSSWLAPRFLYHLVQTDAFIESMGAVVQGALYPAVRPRDIAAFEFELPPLREQTRIVEKLEELLSDLDAGVAELKAAQRKLARYRQSLLKAAVEGSLTADWRARQGTPQESGAELLQRILSERRARWEQKQLAKFAEQGKTPPKGWQAKYPEPVAPDVADLPSLPEGWAWATINQLASVGTGVTPLRSKPAYFTGGDIPWTTSGALNDEIVTSASDHVTPVAVEECRLELYPAGSLLVAMYGEGKTRGKCAELGFASTINQAIAALVFDDAAIAVRRHVKTVLLNAYEAMRKQSSGGVQPNLNLQIIKAFPLPLPPQREQTTIIEHLDTALEALKQQQVAIEKGLAQSAAQRKNLLKSAFAGQLVPQDPNDEPASELLERIRAERRTADTLQSQRRRVSSGRDRSP